MANQPKVSVGLPVYNGAKYLHRAIETLLEQEFSDFELIIADNASTDDTERLCRDYAQSDSRVRYYRNETNIGLAPNHNLVFNLSRGQYFKWAAHDDEYPPAMLRRSVDAFDAAPPSVSVLFSQCELIDETGTSMGLRSDPVEKRDSRPYRRLARLLRHNSLFNFVYGLIRSDHLRRTRLHGPFPSSDWVLFAELAMLGELWEIREPLLRLRAHSGRTFQSHPDPQALRELYDPVAAQRRDWLSIARRADLELFRSAWRVPTRLVDKILCLTTVMSVPYWRLFVNFGGGQKRRLLDALRHFASSGSHAHPSANPQDRTAPKRNALSKQ